VIELRVADVRGCEDVFGAGAGYAVAQIDKIFQQTKQS
jgi:hypothetical protein